MEVFILTPYFSGKLSYAAETNGPPKQKLKAKCFPAHAANVQTRRLGSTSPSLRCSD